MQGPADQARAVFVPSRPRWLAALRTRVVRWPGGEALWKVLVAVIGGIVVVGGLALIPLPGPGWAIVFVGLALWATEFEWAARLLAFARRTLVAWTAWIRRQSRPVQAMVGLVGLLVIAAIAYAIWKLVW
jgi:uncharacterized protein (TIGR02611 family)